MAKPNQPNQDAHTQTWTPARAAMLSVALLIAALISARTGLDAWLVQAAQGLDLAGDVRRELEVLQQFGAPASMIIVLILVFTLDRSRTRRILDLILAAVATSLTALALKMLLGRPRPVLNDPDSIHGPFNAVNVNPDRAEDAIFAWQLGADGVERLWSLPSSHTAAAVALATFLAIVYPRLVWFAVFMAVVVGSCRVLFNAHWPSDVFAGAALAHAIAFMVTRNYMGVRLLDGIWRGTIDPQATEQWRVQRDLDASPAPVPSGG